MTQFSRILGLMVGMAMVAQSGFTATKPTTAILVDKATHQLFVTEYREGRFETVKKFHTTLGKVKGDKEQEGDLKTPEGIYSFKTRLTPPTLKAKFGVMAFYMDYPNMFDRMAGRTGKDIMLHATDTPERLEKNYDSEGCIVLKNEELQEVAPWIRIGLTPILVFDQLTDEYRAPGVPGPLKNVFEKWIAAWESRSIDRYIENYHTDFEAQGMNKDQWKAYKSNLISRYASISIGPEDVRFYRHPKYSMITFTQNYRSKLKGGGSGHRSRGTKILYVAEEAGAPKIIAETYTTLMW
jgi:murein L,D-transpeptidase YafK